MNTVLLIIIIAVVLVTIAPILARAALRRACRKGAAKIHGELTAMFAGGHEFRIVPEEEARQFDSPDEEELRGVLRTAGYRPLGWIEDTTASAVYPHMRTFIECHAMRDGRVCATIMRTAGMRLFDLGTRVSGDRFIVTTNAEANKLQPPPSTEKETLPYATPFMTLHTCHIERLDGRGLSSSRVVPTRCLEDVIAASRLYSQQASEHRRAIGYLSLEELMEMGGGMQQGAVVRQVWEEFRRLQDSSRRAA